MPSPNPNPQRISPIVARMLREHARTVDRLVHIRPTASLRRLYFDAIVELQQKLAKRIGAAKGDTYSAHMHRELLAQLRVGVLRLTAEFGQAMALQAEEVQVESLRDLISNIGRMEKHFTGAEIHLPIEEASRFYGLLDPLKTSLLAEHPTCVARYGTRLIQAGEKALGLSLATGETGMAAIERVQTAMGVNWWQGERIVRTELAASYNATQAAGISAVAKEMLPGLMQRWTEAIDDRTGRPFDDRVALDSMVLHGQLARPGGCFVMPVDNRTSPKVWGKSWQWPPNRPMDRSSLSPWRPEWGVPAWMMLDGHRTDLTREVIAAQWGEAAAKEHSAELRAS